MKIIKKTMNMIKNTETNENDEDDVENNENDENNKVRPVWVGEGAGSSHTDTNTPWK